jgi:hypothetical protein
MQPLNVPKSIASHEAQQCPVPMGSAPYAGPIERRNLLGGVLHDYY